MGGARANMYHSTEMDTVGIQDIKVEGYTDGSAKKCRKTRKHSMQHAY